MNGLLFGVYHLHQPWGMVSSALTGVLLILEVGLVLGLA